MADTLINLSNINHNIVDNNHNEEEPKKKGRGRPRNSDRKTCDPKKEAAALEASDTSSEEIRGYLRYVSDSSDVLESEKLEKQKIKEKKKEVEIAKTKALNEAYQDIFKPKEENKDDKVVMKDDKPLSNKDEMMKQFEMMKEYFRENYKSFHTEIKMYPINRKLFKTIYSEEDPKIVEYIPEKTNIPCWNCTYEFDCLPTCIPTKLHKGAYHVYGCFCSFNCAMAYNAKEHDSDIMRRQLLLKQLYSEVFHVSLVDVDITAAPPKELLQRYGGVLTIEEYRKKSKNLGKEYTKLLPPLIPINLVIQESSEHVEKKPLPLEISNIFRNENSYSLQRTKPLNNKTSKSIDHYF